MRGSLLGHSVGLGGSGKRGSVTPLSKRQNMPLLWPLRQGECHSPPPKRVAGTSRVPHANTDPPTHAGHVPPRAQVVREDFWVLFCCITRSPGSREAKAGSSFDLRRYFYIKETSQSRSLPLRESQHQEGTRGTITSQTEGSITHALSTSNSCLAGASPD